MGSRRAVVIGGGITGVLTARELALAGWDVTVLEGEHVGAGSSSRTAAGIRQQFSTPGTVRGMRYSVGFYKRFAAETEQGICPIVQNGYLFLHGADTWADALARVAMQHEAGLTEVEALEGPALYERFPYVDRERMAGGTWCPTDGFLLPHLVYNDGARRVRELGGAVVQHAPVTGAEHAGGRLRAVRTPKGLFEADLFLDCTNAWTRRTGRVLGGEDLEVDPLKRYLWFLARDGSLPASTVGRMPLVICPTGVYFRPENPDTIIVGRKHDTPPEPAFEHADQDVIEPAYSHKGGVDAVPFQVWMELAEQIPPIGEFAGIQATTCGYYADTPDHNPFLGYDRQVGNLIRLVGFSGHGAMMGPFTALIGRTLAEAGRDVPFADVDGADVDLSCFALGRPYEHHETMVI